MEGVKRKILISLLLGHGLCAGYNLILEGRRAWGDYQRLGGKGAEERKRVIFGPFYDFVAQCKQVIPPESKVFYKGRHIEMLVYHLLPRKAYLANVLAKESTTDSWVVEIDDYLGFNPVKARILPPKP
jgi:hypothetical protein